MTSGRPETTSTTHFIAPQTLSTAARSAADSGRSWPLPTSPTPSAYGRLADDHHADVVARQSVPRRPREYVTSRRRDLLDALRGSSCRVVVVPEPPCHVMVQPPVWLPRSSALLPAT